MRTTRTTRLLAVLMALGLVLAACGDDDSSANASTTTSTTADTTTSAGAGDSSSGATVGVATNDELGDYLVDSAGRTLYLFEKDQGTTTACTGGCADNWPPLVAEGAPQGDDAVTGALSTADGIEANQVVINGHLLYHFAGDVSPGDTNGTAVPSWYAVSPSGDAIDNS